MTARLTRKQQRAIARLRTDTLVDMVGKWGLVREARGLREWVLSPEGELTRADPTAKREASR